MSGFTGSLAISVSGDTGAKYSKNGGAFTASAGTVVSGDSIRAQVTSSASVSTSTGATVTVGTVSDTFTVTTAYVTTASDYDGTNDEQVRASDLVGDADTKEGTFSVWIRKDADTYNTLLSNEFAYFGVFLAGGFDNKFTLLGWRESPSDLQLFNLVSASAYPANGAWLNILASWKTDTGALHLYINDINDKDPASYIMDGVISYTQNEWYIGAYGSLIGPFSGCISEMFFHNTYIDLSVESNRRKFISASSKPVSLGADGSTPLGVQPLIYIPTGDGSGTGNKGSGGAFTTTGALTPCSSSPSG